MNDGVDGKDMLYIIHSARSENKLLDAVTRLCPDARPQFDFCMCVCVCVFAGEIYLRKNSDMYKKNRIKADNK